ncbi:MAG: sulfurtransferase-like selenium metabolism protein YedF [Bacteroidales bacterium]
MHIVDTRGERCPRPIIETKKALKEVREGESFTVLTDNKTSFNNISRFLNDNKIGFSVTEKDGVWTFVVSGSGSDKTLTEAESYCELPSEMPVSGNWAIAVTSDVMGYGDDTLGRRLIKSFFVAVSCLDNLPSVIAFYNAGVKLAVEGTETVEILKELESKGVELILCGTCTDYFKLDGVLSAGKTGDMYQIMQKLSSAAKVIRP